MATSPSMAAGRPGARPWQPWAWCLVLALATGTLGGLLTDRGPWFASLALPPWKPPAWLFGPAWAAIAVMTAASAAMAWNAAGSIARRRSLAGQLGLNAALNLAWSALFFRLHRPDWALADLVLLLGSILILARTLAAWCPPAARGLWPYAVWVAFAGTVNAGIVWLNAPFG